jgi:hypothetical protein
MSGETGQSPVGAQVRCLGRDGNCSNLRFHFIFYTPLNSMVYLNSRNIKTSCTTV